MVQSEIRGRGEAYATKHSLEVVRFLGQGTDGAVWETTRKTAVKVFEREKQYICERDSYIRLAQHNITQINGFSIPKLVSCDDDLLVVEMGIVTAPYVLDFGKVYLDIPIKHTREVLAEWERENEEIWEERWKEVKTILWKLESIGIYYQDPNPGNIHFGDDV